MSEEKKVETKNIKPVTPSIDTVMPVTVAAIQQLAKAIIAAAIINRTSTAKRPDEVANDAEKFFNEIIKKDKQ